jgi:hypothetical protein
VTTFTLLEKAYSSFSSRHFETLLWSLCKDLKVKIKVEGRTTRNWIEIDLAGEDEQVATKLLDREIGLAPVSEGKIKRFSVLKGRILGSEKAVTELGVDVGVFRPGVCDAVIPLKRLQAQLADGRELSLQGLVKLFCLRDFMPLYVKIVGALDRETGRWEAELSEKQLSEFTDWLRSNLERLIVLGAGRGEVEQAVERSKHFRDVVKIESLGLYEHIVTLKLGTDAVGLMPRFGPFLRQASLAPFSPRRIKEEIQ